MNKSDRAETRSDRKSKFTTIGVNEEHFVEQH